MKKYLYPILFWLAIPTITMAIVAVPLVKEGAIERTLYTGDAIKASYFIATSTTATSTFSGGLTVKELKFTPSSMTDVLIYNNRNERIFSIPEYEIIEGNFFDNVYIGTNSGNTGFTGFLNIGIGQNALTGASSVGNTVIGAFSAIGGTTGSYNSVVGYNSLQGLTTGQGNIVLGSFSGNILVDGNRNILIGNYTEATSSDSSYSMNIGNLLYGFNMTGASEGQIAIGTTSAFVNSDGSKARLTVDGSLYISRSPSFLSLGSSTPGGEFSMSPAITTKPIVLFSTSTLTSTSTAFIIDKNGKVGIGINYPTEELTVQGNASISGNITVTDSNATSTFSGGIEIQRDSPVMEFDASANNLVTDASLMHLYSKGKTGDLGIITTGSIDNYVVDNDTSVPHTGFRFLGLQDGALSPLLDINSKVSNNFQGIRIPYNFNNPGILLDGANYETEIFLDDTAGVNGGDLNISSNLNVTSTATSTFAGIINVTNANSTSTFSGAIAVNGNQLYTDKNSGTTFITGKSSMVAKTPALNIRQQATQVYFTFSDPRLDHGMTTQVPTNVFGSMEQFTSDGAGGFIFRGVGSGATRNPLYFVGMNDNASPTVPMITFRGGKKSGTTYGALQAKEAVIQFQNNTTNLMTLLGGGQVGIGSTTPSALFSLQGTTTNPSVPLFLIASSSSNNTTSLTIDSVGNMVLPKNSLLIGTTTKKANTKLIIEDGHIMFADSSNPTVSSCGTSPVLEENSTDSVGEVIVGSDAAPVNSCTITFARVFNTAPHCFIQPESATKNFYYTSTVSTLQIQSADDLDGVSVDWMCIDVQ